MTNEIEDVALFRVKNNVFLIATTKFLATIFNLQD